MMFNEMDVPKYCTPLPWILQPLAPRENGRKVPSQIEPCSGMRRLLGPKLRWVQLNRELFLIVLAGPFQRLKSPIRMSPRHGSGRASIDQKDEARCLHYSWPGEGSGYIKEGEPHTGPCYPWTQYLGPPVTSLP